MSNKAVVLLSGGMDSTTVLAQAIDDGMQPIALTTRYGSKHEEAESEAAKKVMKWYQEERGVTSEHYFQSMPEWIFRGGRSALVDEDVEMPHQTYEEIMENVGPSPTVVPFRNANLLSLAAALAVSARAGYVYAGMHATDAHNWAYPDCTPEFLGAFAACVYIGTYHEVQLRFPFIWEQKIDLVGRAAELEAPLHLTWSCYEPVEVYGSQHAGVGQSHRYQCGECPTCVERIEAFKDWGFIDPVPYAPNQDIDWQGGRQWPTLTSS